MLTRRTTALIAALLALALTSGAHPGSASADPSTSPELVPFTGTRVLTATWGAPSGGYHSYPAIDVALPMGSPVYAAGAGTIVASFSGCPPTGSLSSSCGLDGGLGNAIRIAHADGRHSRYGHLSSLVVASVNVAAGQLIGYSGSSGKSSGPHLHYQETNGASFTAAVDPGVWVACHGGTRVDYGNLQARVGQSVRNDGYGCTGPVGDGGLVRTPNGNIYRIVGGAPLHISRCNYTNGCAGVVHVPDLSQYAPNPRDGALVANVDDGGIYRFAGGAPLWLSSCGYGPGCAGVVEVDAHPFAVNDHMRAVPADGTLVSNHADGGIYRFAGGAPLWISSCGYVPGCGEPITAIDGGTFYRNGAISGAERMRAADGTLISNHADGGIYRFAGGAPLWISSCGYAPGCGGSIAAVDGGTFGRNGSISAAERMRAYPADGTDLRIGETDTIMRVAGGAALQLFDCSVLDGGCPSPIPIDNGTLDRQGAISGSGRLLAAPMDGTILVGKPSGSVWRIAGGFRAAAQGSQGTQVNDSTLERFNPPASEPPTPPAQPVQKCRVPRLRGLRLRAARRKLLRAGCRVGKVRGPRSGRVRRQSPRRGTHAPAGTRVSIRLVRA